MSLILSMASTALLRQNDRHTAPSNGGEPITTDPTGVSTMRRTLFVATILSVTAPAMGQATDAEKELARLSHRVYEAYVRADMSFLDGAFADDWTLITSGGDTRDKAL